MTSNQIARLRFVLFCIFLVAILLGWKLFYVQVTYGSKYKDLAEKQYSVQSSTPYDRGSIFFRKKDGGLVSAATLKGGYILAINPDLVLDERSTFKTLESLITLDEEEFFRKANKIGDPYEEVTDRIDEETAEKIKEKNLPGVSLYKERWRFYPGESMASHVLGYVGYKEDDFSGRYGVERYYNDLLEKNTENVYNNLFAEIFSNLGDLLKPVPKREADIILTIEPVAQAFVEDGLLALYEDVSFDKGGILVINPNSGEIISMAALPNFNPNAYGEEEDIFVFSNPFIEDVYEFGSIVKPLTIAAALDRGVLKEGDTYDDRGYVIIDDKRIENFDGKGRGVVPIQEILNQSLNTGAVHAMQKLGTDAFREYMYSYGIKDKTDTDLPDEVRGIVGNLESGRDIEYATASFGQGIAVTPINITRALSSLANGGILIRPHIVAEFDYRGYPGRVVKTEEQGKVLKAETSERISAMLTTVVDEALRGGAVSLPHYSVSAKTGTAQIPNPEGGYYGDRFLHSFFGYFPSYDPEFLVFMYIVNPKEGRYASETLTGTFVDITKFLINYYDIPPDR